MDDLLVAGDPSAVETTPAASQIAAVSATSTVSPARSNKQQEMRKPSQTELSSADRASVAMGSPVAAPVNGDTSMDISTENAVSHGHRYFL